MEQPIDIMQELVTYWMGTRGVGHTSLMTNGTKESDGVVVIGHTHAQARSISGDCRPLSIYRVDVLRGLRAPIAIDHEALRVLFLDAIRQYGAVKADLRKRERQLEEVRRIARNE